MKKSFFLGLFTALLLLPATLVAQQNDEAIPPDDTCVLQLRLPKGATVTVDGRDYGNKRKLTFKGLEPGRSYESKLGVRFAGGGELRRAVTIQGGRRIVLPVTLPNADRPELVLQTGHSDDITAVAFSPDGQYLLTGSDDRTVVLWEVATGKQLRRYHVHAESQLRNAYELTAVAVSPDGRTIFTADDAVSLWDMATGNRVRSFEVDIVGVWCAALSPDGRTIAANDFKNVGEGENTKPLSAISLWDAATGRKRSTFQAHDAGAFLRCLAFSADSRRLVSGASDNTAILWDVATGRRLRTFRGHNDWVTSAVFSPDGRRVLTACNDDTALLWDTSTGAKLRSFSVDSNWSKDCVAFSPDGKKILSVSEDNVAKLYDAETGTEIRSINTRSISGSYARAVAFSPDGDTLLTASGSGADLWETATGEHVRAFRGHTAPVAAVAVSPDGQRVVSGSEDETGTLWDIAAGRRLATLSGHTWGVNSVAFSPDGRRVLTGSGDKTAILWDAHSGEKLSSFTGSAGYIHAVAFSPDGSKVVTTGGESDEPGEVNLWNADGTKLRSLTGHVAEVNCAAFSPDGRRLLTAAEHGLDRDALRRRIEGAKFKQDVGTAILWDVGTGKRLRSFPANDIWVTPLAFSPDGAEVVIGWNQMANLWDVNSGRQLRVFRGPSGGAGATGIQAVALSPDGQRVLTGGGGSGQPGEVFLWDAATGSLLRRLKGHTSGVQALAFSPDGRTALTGSWDETAILWDVATGRRLRTFKGAEYIIWGVAFSPDGRRALTGSGRYKKSGETILWDVATGRKLRTFGGHTNYVNAVAFSPDARIVLSGSWDDTAILWEANTGRKLRTLQAGGGEMGIVTAVFSRDGRKIVTGGDDVTLWDAQTGARIRTFPGHQDSVFSVAISPDGRTVASASQDHFVILWDAATGKPLQRFYEHTQWVNSVVFSSDGGKVLSGSSDGVAHLWDVGTGRVLASFRGHLGHVNAVAFSPDGRKLLTGGRGKLAILWDVATGRSLHTFKGHSSSVTSVAYAPDGRTVVTGSEDGTIHLWDAATGDQLASLIDLDQGEDWLAVTPEGLFDGSAGAREKVMFRVGGGLNVVPVDRFFQDFYRPGLLAEICRGDRPMPDVELGESLPPKIRIVSPESGKAVTTQQVTLEVEVEDEGGGVRGPWLFQNGARVLAPGGSERRGRSLRRRFVVPLVEGKNRFEVRAASADGSWESEPAEIVLRYEQPLAKPELYLIAVGVSHYALESMQLEFPTADAQAMAGLFQQRGLALYDQVHLTSLADDRATRRGILEAIRQVAAKARPQDTVALFLAGHGTLLGQQYYFLPQDFQRQAQRLEEDVRRTGLWAADIGEALSAVPALKRLLIFDTCQSGKAMELARTARNPFALRGAIERLGRAEGAFTIAATATSADAQEVPDLGHGVLTYSLLAGLRAVDTGPLQEQWVRPSGEEQVADVLAWFSFASAQVPRLTSRYFGHQQDVQHVAAGTSFPVLPIPAGGQPPRIDPTQAAAGSGPRVEGEAGPDVVRSGGPAKGEDLYLLSVGVNQYAQGAMNLRYAAADARAMAELFGRRGAALYASVQVQQVLDAEATRAGILQALERVAQAARPEDTLVVFLAGHGTLVGQRYYFIPHEFQRKAESLDEDIRNQALPADVLADAVAKVPALKRILIFDTCASGGALGVSRKGYDPFAFRGAIEQLGQRQGVFTIAASAAGEEAQEIEQLGHGALTYTLLAALGAIDSGPLAEDPGLHANDPEGLAHVLEWFSFASGQVPRLTRRYLGQEQDVQTSGYGTSFPVLPLRD